MASILGKARTDTSCSPRTGTANDTESGGAKVVYLEPMGLRFDRGDNNSGITIIDITDLDDVRYCFVDCHGMESERQVPLHTPLSGMDYALAYYDPQRRFVVQTQHTQKALKKYGLVQVEALNGKPLIAPFPEKSRRGVRDAADSA